MKCGLKNSTILTMLFVVVVLKKVKFDAIHSHMVKIWSLKVLSISKTGSVSLGENSRM